MVERLGLREDLRDEFSTAFDLREGARACFVFVCGRRSERATVAEMPSRTPAQSVAQRLTAAALGELASLRDDLDNPRPIPPGAFEGEIWKSLKTLAALAHLPIEVAYDRWRESIRDAATRCETPDHLARLTWPPVAFADRRMRWIAGELGRRAVDARLEAEQAKRARELPPGAVGARVFAPPREQRARPGEAPTCDPKRAAELQAQFDAAFDAAFGGDA